MYLKSESRSARFDGGKQLGSANGNGLPRVLRIWKKIAVVSSQQQSSATRTVEQDKPASAVLSFNAFNLFLLSLSSTMRQNYAAWEHRRKVKQAVNLREWRRNKKPILKTMIISANSQRNASGWCQRQSSISRCPSWVWPVWRTAQKDQKRKELEVSVVDLY